MLHEIDLEKKHYKLVKNVINSWKNKCYQTILFCVYKLMHYKLVSWIENKIVSCVMMISISLSSFMHHPLVQLFVSSIQLVTNGRFIAFIGHQNDRKVFKWNIIFHDSEENIK